MRQENGHCTSGPIELAMTVGWNITRLTLLMRVETSGKGDTILAWWPCKLDLSAQSALGHRANLISTVQVYLHRLHTLL